MSEPLLPDHRSKPAKREVLLSEGPGSGAENLFDSQMFDVPSRILVAGKEGTVKNFVTVFKESDHIIMGAEDGEEALQQVGKGHVDLLVMDTHLAKVDGFEVCRRLKSNPQWQYLPVVLLTQSEGTSAHVRGFENGANDVLAKPVHPHLLRSRIKSILKYRHAVAALRKAHKELEQRVQQRTEELSKANTELTREIAERTQTEAALRESEMKFRCVAQSAPDAILYADQQLNLVFLNKAARRMFGFEEAEILGRPWVLLFPDPWREQFRGCIEKLRASGRPQAAAAPLEWKAVRKGGESFPIEISLAAWEADGLVFFSGIIRDITQRKRTETELMAHQTMLRKVSSELSLAEERERRQFATVLHDSLGQDLSFSRFKLQELRAEVRGGGEGGAAGTGGAGGAGSGEKLLKRVDEMAEVLDKMIAGVRSLTFELSTPILYEIGLEAALEWLAEHTAKRYGLPCALELIGERIPLEIERRVLLFQAVREVVLNVVKHARASQVKVRVFRNQRLWRVDVLDDGVGVKLNELGRVERRESEGFGIFSLRERLQYLGGSLRIANRPKGGTHVSLVLPNSSAQPLAPEEEP